MRIFFSGCLEANENNDNWTMATQDTRIKLPKKKVKAKQSLPKELSM